jgi:hypothetical protein
LTLLFNAERWEEELRVNSSVAIIVVIERGLCAELACVFVCKPSFTDR